jgi:hypothetical protein
MSALGQKQTCAVQLGMSAKGQKRTSEHLVCQLLNHFVGAGEQRRGNRYPERPRSTQIDDKV